MNTIHYRLPYGSIVVVGNGGVNKAANLALLQYEDELKAENVKIMKSEQNIWDEIPNTNKRGTKKKKKLIKIK